MPVPGPAPKPSNQLRRRNRPTHEWLEVLNVPFTAGPDLPSRLPDGRAWPAWTRRWWGVVSSMPHCSTWSASDWEFAFDTAALKAQFLIAGNAASAAEIRNRERVLGTTADYRRGLRIRYVDALPPQLGKAGVTVLDDYRDL